MINFDSPGVLYILFYLAAFLCGLIYLLVEGKRMHYASNPWILTIFSSFLMFVIGCKVFMFDNAHWYAIFQNLEWPHVQGRTLIGGIVFGFAGILIAIRWFNLPFSVLDSFAFLIPVTLLLQRTGCFLAGCCYGIPTGQPWSVSYGPHYHAFDDQLSQGLISSQATASLPVHPVQLYEMIGCLMIIAGLLYFRNKQWLRAPGTLLLSSALLYAVLRFSDEFFRATHAASAFGLNKVQWYVLAIGAIALFAIILLERRYQPGKEAGHGQSSYTRELLFFFALVSLYSLSWAFIDTLEVLALYPVLVISMLSLVYTAFTKITVPSMRWSSLGMLMLMIVMTSQITPDKEKKNEEQYHYYTVAMNVLSGNHTFTDEIVAEDCDGNNSYTVAKFKEKYITGGLNVSRSVVKDNTTLTFGLGGQMGRLKETGEDNVNSHRSLTMYAFNPYVRYDMRYFGIGGGLNVGDMPLLKNSFNTDQATLIRRYGVYPQIYVRGGELRTFFGEFRFGDGLGGTFPASQIQLTAGYGFHKTNGVALRLGTSSFAGFLFSTSFPVGTNVMIEPYLGVGNSLFTDDYTKQNNFQAALRLSYQFGRSN